MNWIVFAITTTMESTDGSPFHPIIVVLGIAFALLIAYAIRQALKGTRNDPVDPAHRGFGLWGGDDGGSGD